LSIWTEAHLAFASQPYTIRTPATSRLGAPLLEPPFVEAVNVVVPYNWNQYLSFSMLSLYIF